MAGFPVPPGFSQLTPNFPSGLTAKGQALNNTQTHCAEVLLSIGKSLNSPTVAMVACIFDAIFESDLGIDVQWNPTYGGALAGNVSYFGTFGSPGSDEVTKAEAQQFFAGGQGYQGGGANHLASQSGDAKWIGSQVTAAVPYDSNGYSTQYESQNVPGGLDGVLKEAAAIVQAFGGGQLGGGTQGLGGTGSTANQTGLFTVGDTSNPHEDYFTALNRLGQNAYWYCFSDGEMFYIADGTLLMQQQPARVINRFDPAILSLEGTWDNTAFQFASNHRRRGRIQRKSKLAKITSPTQLTVELICEVDALRGGDVVFVMGLGPMDGLWLVGECERSVFEIFSTLTLVPALAPILAAAGAGSKSGGPSGGGKGTKAGFTNPFPGGWVPNRLDMGYDGTFKGQIVAPFDGQITYAGPFTGWNGSSGVIIKANVDIGLPTRSLYFTEGVAPIVSSGQNVTAGTPIANAANSPYGDSYAQGALGAIEWGVSQDGPVGSQVDTYAIALGVGSGAARAMVLAFATWAQTTLGLAAPSQTGAAGGT